MTLSVKKRQLLKDLQTDFPLVSRPFAQIAKKVGSSEQKVLVELRKLQEEKILRYIGVIFDLGKLGIVSSLVAMRVPKKKLAQVVRVINSYPNISHNYLRADDYNIWFTLSAASETRRRKILGEIIKKTGVKDVLDLKTRRVFKSRAVFELG